jgi:hypothetical protein
MLLKNILCLIITIITILTVGTSISAEKYEVWKQEQLNETYMRSLTKDQCMKKTINTIRDVCKSDNCIKIMAGVSGDCVTWASGDKRSFCKEYRNRYTKTYCLSGELDAKRCMLVYFGETTYCSIEEIPLQLGSANIVIPVPLDTSELCMDSGKTRNELENIISNKQRLLSCFINDEKWQNNSHEYIYLVMSNNNMFDKHVDSLQFQTIKKSFYTEMVTLAEELKSKKQIHSSPEALNQAESINKIIVDHVDRLHSSERIELLIHSENADMQINGKRVKARALVGSGLLLVDGKVIRLKVSKFAEKNQSFSNKDYVDIKYKIIDWAYSITARNKI